MLDLDSHQKETFRANVDALQRTWGGPLRLDPSRESLARVELDVRAGQLHLRVMSESGRWVTIHGRRPNEEGAAWWNNCGATHDTLGPVVVIGAGLGYGIHAALNSHPKARVLVVEHEPAMTIVLLAARDWRPWIQQRRLGVLAGPDYVGLTDFVASFGSDDLPPMVVSHPVLTRERGADAVEAARAVKRVVSEGRHNRAARAAFGGRYLVNTLANLGAILEAGHVTDFDGAAGGRPAIIAGAGPSLNRNIEELRPFRDRAILIAAGSAMRPLLASGIEVDLLVALDPGDLNAKNLAGTSEGNHTLLVAEGSLPSEVLREFRGRTIAFRVGDNHPWPWLRSLGVDPGALRAWGSVITSSFDLAIRMGCDPIVFVGADHAYTNGQPYCRNTTWEKDWRDVERCGMPMADIWRYWMESRPVVMAQSSRGEAVESASHLLAYRDWLVDASVRAAPIRVINATGAGVLWGGRIEIMGVENAMAGKVTINPPALAGLRHRARLDANARSSGASLAMRIGRQGSQSLCDSWAQDVGTLDARHVRAALAAGLDDWNAYEAAVETDRRVPGCADVRDG